jgi:putative tryptophan/tyrosine transport system substrate-binding protein
MRRREFVIAAAGTVLAWAASADAQQAGKKPRVGLLAPGRPDAPPTDLNIRVVNAFRQRLRDLGYIEGQNIGLEIRWDEGQMDRHVTFAAELVRMGVDVIVAGTSPVTLWAREATRTIPIVMAAFGGGDPVDLGLAASLAHPGGNVTGVVLQTHLLPGKRLELLKEAVPKVSRVALLQNGERHPHAIQGYETAAQALGIDLKSFDVKSAAEFESIFKEAKQQATQAVILAQSAFFAVYAARIAELALRYGLPTIAGETGFAQQGGFMNYGPDIVDAWRNSAAYVDKILKGARPGDLPMEQAARFELVINLKTAEALGLTIPPSLLALADEVVE